MAAENDRPRTPHRLRPMLGASVAPEIRATVLEHAARRGTTIARAMEELIAAGRAALSASKHPPAMVAAGALEP